MIICMHASWHVYVSLCLYICCSFSSVQGCTNITAVAEGNSNITPYILVTGDIAGPMQAFLVVDKTIISEVPLLYDLPFALMAAFFVFNICYPKCCNHLYSFMEVVTLSYPAQKTSATIKYFLSSLN